MDGATTPGSALIKQEVGNRDCLAGDEFSVALFQLHVNPDECDPQALFDALIPKLSSDDYLNQLPAERFVELLTLMYVLEKRVSHSPVLTAFHELITGIGVRQIRRANWNFLSGAASIVAYFTGSDGLDERSVYLEKLMQAFDAFFVTGAENDGLGRKASDLLNAYSLATGGHRC